MKKVIAFLLVAAIFALTACTDPNAGQQLPEKDLSKSVATDIKATPQARQQVEILSSGYTAEKGYNGYYVHYSIKLRNPNADVALQYPKFRLTSRSEDGSVLGTHDQTLKVIYPNDTVAYGSFFSCEQEPAYVDFEVIKPAEGDWLKPAQLDYPEYTPLVVEGASRLKSSVTGEVRNDNDYDIDNAAVSVVFKDSEGNLKGGYTTFVKSIPAGGKVPFEINPSRQIFTEMFEVYAQPWV